MKILITSELYAPLINGVVTSIVTLKEALTNLGHDVRVVTLGKRTTASVNENVYYCSSIACEKIYPGARLMLKTDPDILDKIIDWEPDIIHSQSEFSTFRLAKKIAKYLDIPIVHTYHTAYEDYTHYFAPNYAIGRKMTQVFSKILSNSIDTIIAPTEKMANLLTSYDVKSDIEVIPTGIPLNRYINPYSQNELESLKSKLNIPKNNQILLFVGRLAKEKNIEELINYLNRLKMKNISFLIVGDGPYRGDLEYLVTNKGMENQVIFTGMIESSQLAQYYQLADIFVNASTSESQGLTYIEAMASSLIPLCREDDSLTGVIYNYKNGFQYQNFQDFQNYLTQLLNNHDLRQNLGHQAQHFVLHKYSDQKFAQCMEQVYEKTVHQRLALKVTV